MLGMKCHVGLELNLNTNFEQIEEKDAIENIFNLGNNKVEVLTRSGKSVKYL